MRNSASSTATSRRVDQAGVGIISSLIGFLVFACLLLLAVQVAFDLYARSTLGAVAADAARIVAGSDAGATAQSVSDAEAAARAELGGEGRVARFQWTVGPQDVAVTISVPPTRFLPAAVTGAVGLADVSGGARVRLERVG